jgi:hypothetical protein
MHSGTRQVAVKVIQLKTYLHTSLSYRVETRATLFSFLEEMDDVCDSLFGAKLKCETLAKFIWTAAQTHGPAEFGIGTQACRKWNHWNA